MKQILIIAFLFSPLSGANPPYSDLTLEKLSKLQEAALDANYAYEQTRYLSNNIGPRLSGSAQAQQAVEYVADEMRKLGLSVTLQKVKVPHWVRGEEKCEVIDAKGLAKGTAQKVVITALGGSVATPPSGITADLIVVKSFDDLEKLGRDQIAGKIVLFNNKFDVAMQDSGYGDAAYGRAVVYRGRGASAAARFGAVAVLVRSAGSSKNRTPHTGMMRYLPDAPKIPAVATTSEDAEMLADLASQGRVRLHLLSTPKTLPDADSFNVIGDLKGSEKPDEVVVVGGHLDSWDLGTGALDDACGVALSMQVPFLLKKLGIVPKRTIRVVAFMAEEVGLAGGKGYFEHYKADMPKHFAAIESDLGASHALGFYFMGKAEALPMLKPLSKILDKQGASLLEKTDDGVGGDIDPMHEAGVPLFAPKLDTRSYFRYHHTSADTFERIDRKELNEQGAVMVVLAYGLANLEVALPR